MLLSILALELRYLNICQHQSMIKWLQISLHSLQPTDELVANSINNHQINNNKYFMFTRDIVSNSDLNKRWTLDYSVLWHHAYYKIVKILIDIQFAMFYLPFSVHASLEQGLHTDIVIYIYQLLSSKLKLLLREWATVN